MPEASDCYGSPLPGRDGQHCSVADSRPNGMERVESQAKAFGVEYGICQQVIEIDEHRTQHEQPGLLPVVLPEQPGEDEWSHEVKRIVEGVPEGIECEFQYDRESSLGAISQWLG